MKKSRIIFLSLILLVSCSLENTENHLGLWHITTEISNGVSIKCNACPFITFSKNDMGELKMPSNKRYKFKYDFTEDKIIFSFIDSQDYFKESEYYYKLYHEKDLNFLELSSLKEQRKYILSRIK